MYEDVVQFRPFAWKCPHCRRDTTVVQANLENGNVGFERDSLAGQAMLFYRRVICPNPDCRKDEFTVSVKRAAYMDHVDEWNVGSDVGRGEVRFFPKSNAETFPAYVPQAVRDDYEEACLIVGDSPKAAATLARRALQGIVRDFWGATGRTLKDEIDSVQAHCDPLIWGAMDAVRKVGNIGAHMEKDIGVVIDVEPREAELLLGLIERLVRETYVARDHRVQSMKALMDLAADKTIKKTTPGALGAGAAA